MKITRVEAYAVEAGLKKEYWGSQAWSGRALTEDGGPDNRWQGFPPAGRMQPIYASGICTVIVKVITDNGIVGWGEAKAPVAPRVAQTIITDLLTEMVVGKDPRDVIRLWEEMYASMRLRDHSHGFLLEAISGIDIALWDILGKSLSVPIYRLLGGAFRREIPVYASGVPGLNHDAPPERWEKMRQQAQTFVRGGFRAMKVAIGHDVVGDVASVAAIREEVGEQIALYADAAGRYDVADAARLAQSLEALSVGFLEAPLPPEDLDGYAELAGKTRLRLANDLLFNRFQVRDFLVRRALSVVQPDVCRSGGITECHRIAQLADVFGAAFQPHISIGSILHFVASLHSAAAAPNLLRMEFWAGENPLGDSLLPAPLLTLQDGCIAVPQGPGLGVDFSEEKLFSAAKRQE